MIEEAHVPECVLLLARMTRRRLRLAVRAGYPTTRSFPSWRDRISEHFPAAPAERAYIGIPPAVLATAPQVSTQDESFDPLAIPAAWTERARAELESRPGGATTESEAPAKLAAPAIASAGPAAVDLLAVGSNPVTESSDVEPAARQPMECSAVASEPLTSTATIAVESPEQGLVVAAEDATVRGADPTGISAAILEMVSAAVAPVDDSSQYIENDAAAAETVASASLPSVAFVPAGTIEPPLALEPTPIRASMADIDSADGSSERPVGLYPSRTDLPSSLVMRCEEAALAAPQVSEPFETIPKTSPQASSIVAVQDESARPSVSRTIIVPVFVVHPPVDISAAPSISRAVSPAPSPTEQSGHNRIGLNYRRPMPRPKVNGFVVDFHCHLLAARHAPVWFEAADHYGIDCFVTMSPLEEAAALQRDWGSRLQFIAVPTWGEAAAAMSPAQWVDDFHRRLEAFYNLGSRIVKFHAAPGTQVQRGLRLDSPLYQPLFREITARKMGVMTHIGDPDLWYRGKYGATPELAAKFGTREEHYQMWEALLVEHPGVPWVGAHLGGNPEDPARLQRLLDRFPNLWLDISATRWMAREVSQRRDASREFFIRNHGRLLFGTDQVSGDDRGFDFLASRFWTHRKLWETAYAGPSPITDPDLPPETEPTLRGLALPDQVLQSLYHDNAVQYLANVGAGFGGWG